MGSAREHFEGLRVDYYRIVDACIEGYRRVKERIFSYLVETEVVRLDFVGRGTKALY